MRFNRSVDFLPDAKHLSTTDSMHSLIFSVKGHGVESICGRGLLEVYEWWTDAVSAGDLEEVY